MDNNLPSDPKELARLVGRRVKKVLKDLDLIIVRPRLTRSEDSWASDGEVPIVGNTTYNNCITSMCRVFGVPDNISNGTMKGFKTYNWTVDNSLIVLACHDGNVIVFDVVVYFESSVTIVTPAKD